jgi:diamine N-acetyltransferase
MVKQLDMKECGLTGKNLRLRALEPGDVDLLYTWENDPAIWKASNTLTPFSRFQIEEYVINGQHDLFAAKQLRLMIDLAEPGHAIKSIGTIDMFDFDPVHRRAGLGILIREEFRDRGFGRETMEIFIPYAFDTLSLHQLYCNISSDNLASLHMFEKLGFKKCGIKKDWNLHGRKWQDECMFQLINHAGQED